MDGEFLSQPTAAGVLNLREPVARRLPLVLTSPHSGSEYPADFVAVSRLDPLALRQSEVSFVDELFAAAPQLGAPLLSARFPRAYLDVNREAYELDPAMFSDALPSYVNAGSPRVRHDRPHRCQRREHLRREVALRRCRTAHRVPLPPLPPNAAPAGPRDGGHVRRLSPRRLPFDAIGLRLRPRRRRYRTRRLLRCGLRPLHHRGGSSASRRSWFQGGDQCALCRGLHDGILRTAENASSRPADRDQPGALYGRAQLLQKAKFCAIGRGPRPSDRAAGPGCAGLSAKDRLRLDMPIDALPRHSHLRGGASTRGRTRNSG